MSNNPLLDKYMRDMQKQIEKEVFNSFSFSTASTSTNAPTSFSEKDIKAAIDLVKDYEPLPFDLIKVSEKGFDKLKDKLNAEERIENYITVFGSVQILIRDYIPDNMAILMSCDNVYAVVDLGA